MVQLMVLNLNSRPILFRYGSGMYQQINTPYCSKPVGTEKDRSGGVRGRREVSETMRQWAAGGRENRGGETEGWNREGGREREEFDRIDSLSLSRLKTQKHKLN